MEENKEVQLGGFVKSIVQTKRDGSEEISYRIIQQSHAAEKLAGFVVEKIAWDPGRNDWRKFNGYCWPQAEDGEADIFISTVCRGETVPIGYSDAWYRGAVNQLQKQGFISRKPDIEGVIPFKNGLLDVERYGEEGCLEEITYKNAQSWCLPYEYDPLANCENFLDWLGTAVDHDEGTIEFIRAFINCMLVGRNKDLQFFLHVKGPAGTGKSTFVRLLEEMMGCDATVTTTMARLKTNRFELIRLINKKFLTLNEAGKFPYVEELLRICGGDSLVAEDKGIRKNTEFQFNGAVLLAGNPDFKVPSEYSGAMARRRRTIVFKNIISQDERLLWTQKGGEESILYPEIPGMIIWALAMPPKRVYEVILNPPPSIKLANDIAELAGNGLSSWINQYLLPVVPDELEKPSKVYIGSAQMSMREGTSRYGDDPLEDDKSKLLPAYLSYCSREGFSKPLPRDIFAKELCITANRIFSVNFIHRPVNKKKPSEFARDNVGFYIVNIRFKTSDEMVIE